ncbi:MAG: carboxypeptidase-like regulatory domain-containing protein [Bacteroidales bacterium]|nr:carboxypeptidase-like regulatory domain-containing protein [Bacteroidales bacterium]
MKIFGSLIFICLTLTLFGQNQSSRINVQGRILYKETNEPIPYVNILNYRLQNGTISDMKGYFQIFVPNAHDSLIISCIGYKKQIIPLSEKKAFYTIYLEQNIQLLNAVTITAPDYSYLYDLLMECKKNASFENRTTKAYYEIKSYSGDTQIELLESFFNADLKGYDLSELELKTGRFALKKAGNRFFNSMESSRAIIMNRLFIENEYFPQSPLEFSNAKTKKRFWLEPEKKYLENTNDSIYVIRYKPKDTSGMFFKGQIWIDPQKKHIIKMTFNCRNCSVTPFLPLFSTDKLSNMAMF